MWWGGTLTDAFAGLLNALFGGIQAQVTTDVVDWMCHISIFTGGRVQLRILPDRPRGADGRPSRARPHTTACRRRDRPRDQLPHLALPRARAATERRRGNHPHDGNSPGGRPAHSPSTPPTQKRNRALTLISTRTREVSAPRLSVLTRRARGRRGR